VTVSGHCHWQRAVNYWLGGVIDRQLTALFPLDGALFMTEMFGYTNLQPGDIPVQKQEWFIAGFAGNTGAPPTPAELQDCTPCKVSQQGLISWQWSWLGGNV
jgi:hypothetical protein